VFPFLKSETVNGNQHHGRFQKAECKLKLDIFKFKGGTIEMLAVFLLIDLVLRSYWNNEFIIDCWVLFSWHFYSCVCLFKIFKI